MHLELRIIGCLQGIIIRQVANGLDGVCFQSGKARRIIRDNLEIERLNLRRAVPVVEIGFQKDRYTEVMFDKAECPATDRGFGQCTRLDGSRAGNGKGWHTQKTGQRIMRFSQHKLHLVVANYAYAGENAFEVSP